MDNCTHQWISNSGSNDKPCVYCKRCPVLKLHICIKESFRFRLIELRQLPPETSQSAKPTNRLQTLELRLISLENQIDEILGKIKQIEGILAKLNG